MTARYADRVALMSADGRVVETGDPRHLMEDEGSRLYELINKVCISNIRSSHWSIVSRSRRLSSGQLALVLQVPNIGRPHRPRQFYAFKYYDRDRPPRTAFVGCDGRVHILNQR